MITYRSTILFFLALLSVTYLNAQQVIARDSIHLDGKFSSIYFAGTDANYILIKNKDMIKLMCYDTTFHSCKVVNYDIGQLQNNNDLIGAAQTGQVITILFCSKWHSHFSTITYDIHTRQFKAGINFDTDDYVYLSWFPMYDRLNVLALKKKTSLLSVVGIDASGHTTQSKFDLSKEEFLVGPAKSNLDYALVDNTNTSLIGLLTVQKINPNTYHTDFSVRQVCKLFYTENELWMTINKSDMAMQAIQLDILHGTYHYYKIPYAHNAKQPYEPYDVNSYLSGHTLFTALDYPTGLSLGIYDLDQEKYIRQWGPGISSLDSFITSPLVDENPIKDKADTLKSWDKFHRRMSGRLLSVTTNRVANGDLELYVGGMVEIFTGIGMGMMPGANLGSFSPNPQPIPIKAHYYFSGALDASMNKTAMSQEGTTYHNFQKEYFFQRSLSDEWQLMQFQRAGIFYLGEYLDGNDIYMISQFK